NAPEKRPEIFVDIARQCRERNLPLEFIMVGDFYELTTRVGSNVTILGEVFDREKLNEVYSDAHLILVTSWREGFPLVIMEGMGHGVVPVATKVGEIPSYISSSTFRNGFLIENDEQEKNIVDAFVEQIDKLCKDRELLREYSNNAYIFAEQSFGEENFEQAYRKLLLGTPGEKLSDKA
ncbi:MAG TPA: glycosyltransferase family 4 protein, partial [Cyclobacteriaceae bacterium]|nr:glycosyltransferase family 4 protein [Cyclobacteriaceae bacterium]